MLANLHHDSTIRSGFGSWGGQGWLHGELISFWDGATRFWEGSNTYKAVLGSMQVRPTNKYQGPKDVQQMTVVMVGIFRRPVRWDHGCRGDWEGL